MNRRTLLGAMSGTKIALVGGCLDRSGDLADTDDENNRSCERDGEAGDSNGDDDTDESAGPPASDRTDDPEVTIEAVETDGCIDFDATVSSQGDGDDPPELTFELTNTAPETRVVGDFAGLEVPFNQTALSMDDRDEFIQLIASGAVEERGGCWVSAPVASIRAFATLEADETLVADVDIVTGATPPDDERSEDGCYGIGAYSTERSFEILPESATPSGTTDYEDQILERPKISLSVSID